jgi:hypothetical protein
VDHGLGDFLRNARGTGQINPRNRWIKLADQNDGNFQTATIRDVDKRPTPTFVKPYFHNGVIKDLKTVVHFYNTRDVLPHCAKGVDDPGFGERRRAKGYAFASTWISISRRCGTLTKMSLFVTNRWMLPEAVRLSIQSTPSTIHCRWTDPIRLLFPKCGHRKTRCPGPEGQQAHLHLRHYLVDSQCVPASKR